MKPLKYRFIFIISVIALGINSCISSEGSKPELRVHKNVILKNHDSDLPDYGDMPKGTPRPTYSYFDFEQPESFLDLDTGVQEVSEGTDLYYDFSCGSHCFHDAFLFEGVFSVVAETTEPGFEGCKNRLFNQLGEGKYDMQIKKGYFICLLTNEGRISQVSVNDIYLEYELAVIEVSVKTWEPIVITDRN